MVTQPSTCLRLSDNTAGAITWWRRLPEKFCRNPIEVSAAHELVAVDGVGKLVEKIGQIIVEILSRHPYPQISTMA